jgi:hypothetical protein
MAKSRSRDDSAAFVELEELEGEIEAMKSRALFRTGSRREISRRDRQRYDYATQREAEILDAAGIEWRT